MLNKTRQVNVDAGEEPEPQTSTLQIFDLQHGRVLDEITLQGEVRDLSAARIPQWYNTNLNYVCALVRTDLVDPAGAKTQSPYSVEMLAFTDGHPRFKRFSMVRLDVRLVPERQALAVIDEEDPSRERLPSQLSGQKALTVPAGEGHPDVKDPSLTDY